MNSLWFVGTVKGIHCSLLFSSQGVPPERLIAPMSRQSSGMSRINSLQQQLCGIGMPELVRMQVGHSRQVPNLPDRITPPKVGQPLATMPMVVG
jgi:hypothetical protein